LHRHGIVHRDIKLENILVSFDAKNEPLIKIIDFGLATIIYEGQVILRPCGSLAFSSPEIVKKTYYDLKTDVWSMGVVLYSILT
jgi:serine/threonine protein kinase